MVLFWGYRERKETKASLEVLGRRESKENLDIL